MHISLKDPNTTTTGYKYDALSRLLSVIQPGDIKISYGYDSNDDLISVTDANGNATTYKYDDMGRVYQVISPDTGTTTYTYDPAGNMTSKTDASGVTIAYSYDALNRLTKIDFPIDTDVLYAYDACPNGKGRLCGMTDPSGTTTYEYSLKGQVTKETKVIDGITYVTQYTYTLNGDIASITYPGGRVVSYNYQSGLLKEITTTKGGTTSSIASNVVQGAFGGIGALTYGNGLSRTVTFDNQGRIGSIVTGSVQKLQYGYDANSNITGITDNVDNAKSKTYAYDVLDRLTGATGPWGSLAYTYDGVGNRKTETTATGTTNYTYTANKLMSGIGEKTLTFGYDGNGNATAENGRQYVYNQNQRLIRAAEGATAVGEYVYSANGQRVKKTAGGVTTVYHFDINGRLLGESDGTDTVSVEYVYLNGQPVAKIDASGVYYILTDHLGTPVVMTDGSGQKVWEIESKPFGDVPSITGSATLNIRFPGQYYDAETGLHYNYFRDYEPKVGRYIEADPIGLVGGDLDLYVFASSNSLIFVDLWGLHEVYYLSLLKMLKPPYDYWVITYDDNGIPVNISSGSINPDPKQKNCKKGCPSIQNGTYKFRRDIKTSSHPAYPALRVNDAMYVPTRAPNPNQNYKSVMNGVWIHKGCKTRTCAEGCLTISPDDWLNFMKNFPRGSRGQVTISDE